LRVDRLQLSRSLDRPAAVLLTIVAAYYLAVAFVY